MNSVDISRLSAEQLWERLIELAKMERGATCDLVETLAEADRRGLHKDHAYVSLFECCVHKLGFSEAAAYRRIRAARALKLFAPIGPLLRQGKLTLESVALLHPFLKDEDAAALVASASGKRVWEVERLVAARRTEEPRRDVVRFVAPALAEPIAVPETADSPLFSFPAVALPGPAILPERRSDPPAEAPRPPIIGSVQPPVPDEPPAASGRHEAPLPPSRHAVRIAFTADESFFRLLKEAQAAMRHKYPNGRLDGIFRDALTALLKKKRPWAP